jgi:hypothetical protein
VFLERKFLLLRNWGFLKYFNKVSTFKIMKELTEKYINGENKEFLPWTKVRK